MRHTGDFIHRRVTGDENVWVYYAGVETDTHEIDVATSAMWRSLTCCLLAGERMCETTR
ncbi:MAG TPA: hypothetical protein VGL98_07005 [Gammaproteobacteria bacterium]